MTYRPSMATIKLKDVRYFREHGKCQCGKPSNGKLFGQNDKEVYGEFCTTCAEDIIATAKSWRNVDARRAALFATQD